MFCRASQGRSSTSCCFRKVNLLMQLVLNLLSVLLRTCLIAISEAIKGRNISVSQVLTVWKLYFIQSSP